MPDPNASHYPQSPKIRAWKIAHALMWQRWQDFIDFNALKKRNLELPQKLALDALCDAIGMLYGEYLTDHIKEYQELEAQLLKRFNSDAGGHEYSV